MQRKVEHQSAFEGVEEEKGEHKLMRLQKVGQMKDNKIKTEHTHTHTHIYITNKYLKQVPKYFFIGKLSNS